MVHKINSYGFSIEEIEKLEKKREYNRIQQKKSRDKLPPGYKHRRPPPLLKTTVEHKIVVLTFD